MGRGCIIKLRRVGGFGILNFWIILTLRHRKMHLTMLSFNWASIHPQLTILSWWLNDYVALCIPERVSWDRFQSVFLALTRHSIIVSSELMFELYSVPSLAYCIDGIMSFYQNRLPPPTQPFSANGLVISFNTASTSVIPILRGKGLLNLTKRCCRISPFVKESQQSILGYHGALLNLLNTFSS